MTSTLSVPVRILADVHEIEGGGYRAEVRRHPGCIAQAETLEALKENLVLAIEDWLNGLPLKTEDEAGLLAEIQCSIAMAELFPQPNTYLPTPFWADDETAVD